ncbi:MAG TPA: heme biosynthesis HemY N-terminal domain-containing protein [Agitococcus sp.]|jgi:HemY protein|nr:hypothetical protein [Moraxellaceae bacterium]MCC6374284.1 hypothetical protein [Moraxellaceae bacterium]HQV79396.1 heme biosynthesis HemY N-terminal domain-containing protein [Agitococcus sp.]
MINVLFGLLFIIVGVALGFAFIEDSGYVLLVWRNTSIEMSLMLAVIALTTALVSAFVLLEVLLGTLGLRALFKRWLTLRRYQQAQRYFGQGMAMLSLDNHAAAEKLFVRSAKAATEPLAAYLAAVKAAQAQQAVQRAEDYLNLINDKKHHLTVHIERIKLWLATGQWEAAAARLKSIYPHYKKERVISQLLLEALVKLQAWSDLLEWLPILSKAPTDTLPQQALLQSAYLHSFEFIAKTTGRVDKTHAFGQLQNFWQQVPRHYQRDTDVVLSYVQTLISLACYDESARICYRVLGEQWHNGLVTLYGRILHADPEIALEQAKQWLVLHPQSPALLLTLGRLSMQCHQWQAAKGYFEQSLVLHKNPETFAEFVRLLQHSNDPEAGHYLIAGLNQLLKQPLPALPLP